MKEQLFLTDLILKPAPSFENFVTGDNEELLFTLQHLTAGISVFLWGDAGSGKTHLLQALAHDHTFYHAQTFPRTMEQLAAYSAGGLFLIDDVQDFDEEQQTVLFNLYNMWQAHRLQADAFSIVASGNVPPMQMIMREDLRNRLGWGLVYQVHLLNDQDCQDALEKRAREKGLHLSKEVLHWIFTYCPRDIRTLFALLEALDAYSLGQQRPITIPLLKNLIQSKELFQ